METTYTQTFEMDDRTLCYDSGKSMLLCRDSGTCKNLWIKKIEDINHIDSAIEDSERYYIGCESNDIKGYYIAVNKDTGSTEWFIPGKPYFQIIFSGYLFLIFADEKKTFYLLKVERSDGGKLWYHRIDDDLSEYSFRSDRILLEYESGKKETISPSTGSIMH